MNIETLPTGKHILRINGPMKLAQKKDSIDFNAELITIPFWYFPENSIPAATLDEFSVENTSEK